MASVLPTKFNSARLSVVDWTATLHLASGRVAIENELARILTEPVLEHLPPPLQLGAGGVADWVNATAGQGTVMEVRERATNDLLGVLILAEFNEDGKVNVHIGYLLGESAWGKGYASELILALVQALSNLNCRLLGGVGHGNPASARVLEKAGFVRSVELSDEDTDMFVVEIGGKNNGI